MGPRAPDGRRRSRRGRRSSEPWPPCSSTRRRREGQEARVAAVEEGAADFLPLPRHGFLTSFAPSSTSATVSASGVGSARRRGGVNRSLLGVAAARAGSASRRRQPEPAGARRREPARRGIRDGRNEIRDPRRGAGRGGTGARATTRRDRTSGGVLELWGGGRGAAARGAAAAAAAARVLQLWERRWARAWGRRRHWCRS
ncbi:hypothetical protein C2845_PM11G28030 [Panicum miliaceum]|uniref:Uncharacterized protein n=1 Tax=Panicum miliaceum TaxID=4540 RepID=A0A3L6RR55_PANMI|nr:hypothetical protein C2845_PM11G28030 [Panicum miliaceum]